MHPLAWRDDRSVHVVTRGNVDGIMSSALAFRVHPRARVSYVSSGAGAIEALRKDISSRLVYLIDVGLSPKLAKTVENKAKTDQQVVILDHHQQSEEHALGLGEHVTTRFEDGVSAATVAWHYWGLNGVSHRLAAIADLVEYCRSDALELARTDFGFERIATESRMLDFAWRLRIEDDRFREETARKLAAGAWPSEIGEVKRRYFQVLNENRWARARDRVRSRVRIEGDLAILNFGRRRPSLLGFATRALTSVARDEGCHVAVLVNRRRDLASVALRAIGEPVLNLGRFVEAFTREHGIVGGGHPASAGAKIHTRDVPLFLEAVAAAV